MHRPSIYPMTLESLRQYENNPNAFAILTQRETPLNIPTHYCFWHDYSDSISMLRLGYKETLKPFQVAGFCKDVDEGLVLQAKHLKIMKDWTLITEENRMRKQIQESISYNKASKERIEAINKAKELK